MADDTITEADVAPAASVLGEHAYTPAEETCGACGASNVVPTQRPEDLAAPQGVKWECVACSAGNILGGRPALPPAEYVLECSSCSSTFDPNLVDQDADGTWTCANCGQTQRNVHLGETGSGTTTARTA